MNAFGAGKPELTTVLFFGGGDRPLVLRIRTPLVLLLPLQPQAPEQGRSPLFGLSLDGRMRKGNFPLDLCCVSNQLTRSLQTE